MSEYEKTLEEENQRLHAELETLRKLLFDIAPHLDKMFASFEKDVMKINNGFYEKDQGCAILLGKIKKERDTVKQQLSSL